MKILGTKATHLVFEDDELAAAEHCHVGASVEMNGKVFDWIATVIGT